MRQGILIAAEGDDGAGKTTALKAAAKALEQKGYDVLLTREPGGSPVAEKIRTLLLDPDNLMDARTEALLYAASRREHYVRTIRPALRQGKIILCDRFLDSSCAYQGAGRELGMEAIEALNDFGLEGFRPDRTLYFSLNPEISKARMIERGDMNRLDLENDAFHQRVQEGFARLIERDPGRFVIIDADGSPDQTAKRTADAIEAVIKDSARG